MAKSALKKAVETAGGQTALAELIGSTQGHVSKWLERNYVPPEFVLTIERATGISRHELRPDIYPVEELQGFAGTTAPIPISPGYRAADLIAMKPRWTVAELDALYEQGKLAKERWELVGGEIRMMAAKGNFHEELKVNLTMYWGRRLSEKFVFATETTFRLTPDVFLEPDFVFFPRAERLANLRPEIVKLIVEVASTSLNYDLGEKAKLYAGFGIQELWVINAKTMQTHVFTKPSEEGYLERRIVDAEHLLSPDFAPELAVKIAELPLI
jgi:Uma2 family endonuclease/DNA-binding transcriptional regulator YdaS (Cro superfamily)